ncbi:MAG TPA: tagaturonate epimerase family protein [Terriglobia bacterium]|nr:tagaturonate epimerase family protein [Terriglobia bacterium]
MDNASGKKLDPTEVTALADLVLQRLQAGPLNAPLRAQLEREAEAAGFSSVRPHMGSLAKDPENPSIGYIAADIPSDGKMQPVLLQISRATDQVPSLFAHAIVSERALAASGREISFRAFPFASCDYENIRTFSERVDRQFIPRPQRSLPAIAAGNRHPEISLPAVFEAYREILQKSGVNWASTGQLSATREMTTDEALANRDGEDPTAAGHTRVSIRHLYHAGIWAAVRAGWREGYNAEADHFIVSGNSPQEIARSVEVVKEAIRHAVGYSKFTTDTSKLFLLEADTRHPKAWSDATIAERFERSFSRDEQNWVLSEFSKPVRIGGAQYEFSNNEILRLAVKFGESLKLNEELFDYIQAAKAQQKLSTAFDFEPSLDEAETLTTAKELFFYMHWLKTRGRPAQLVPPNLGFKKRQAYPVAMATSEVGGIGLEDYCHHKMWPELPVRVQREFGGKPLDELAARVTELAAVARHFDATLSIHSGSGKQAEVLEKIGKATSGRVNYKISGELQLQLFDVLSEQPADSPWRRIYDRMVDRANRFAEKGAFGSESELADYYIKLGRGAYLGNPARGRVDGNLFLVFWLGNVVGSRDLQSPDGDRRFFKEKLDEIPEDIVQEVQRRNSRYVVWLADHLQG